MTPARSVQFKDPNLLLEMFKEQGIASFAIKAGGSKVPPAFKYEGEDHEEAVQLLDRFLKLLVKSESAGIYSLCMYDDLNGKTITDQTPCGLAWNFRFNDYDKSSMSGMSGGYGELLNELKELKEKIAEMEAEKEGDTDIMGTIGQIMEIPALQPILMGLSEKVVDWLKGNKVGELRRVSGVPDISVYEEKKCESCGITFPAWSHDPGIYTALNQLYAIEPDLNKLLEKLADIAVNKPAKWKMYLKIFKSI